MKKIFKINYDKGLTKNIQYKKFCSMKEMFDFITNENEKSILKINYAVGYYQKETLKKERCFLLKYSFGGDLQ